MMDLTRWFHMPGEDVVLHAQVADRKGRSKAASTTAKEKDVEVSLNGNGPSIKLRISMAILINAGIGLMVFGTIFAILRADVEGLKVQVKELQNTQPVIQQQLVEVKSTLGYVREDLIYIRGRIDDQTTKKGK